MPHLPHELQKVQGQGPGGACRVQGSAFCIKKVAGDLLLGAGASDQTSLNQRPGFSPFPWRERNGRLARQRR